MTIWKNKTGIQLAARINEGRSDLIPPMNHPPKINIAKLFTRGMLILNSGLALSYIVLWGSTVWQNQFWRADFSAYYTGWSIVYDGLGKQLYDFDLQKQYQLKILDGRSFKDNLLPFTYPPHMAAYFAPLAYFPRAYAFIIWTFLECILLVFLLRLLHTFTHAWPPYDKWLAISVICGFPAVLTNFLLGALSLLLLVCLWKYYLALRDGYDNLSGLWLAVGFFKPQLILLPGMLLVTARQWKAMITFLIAIALLFITSSVGMGWQIWIEFLKMLRKMNDLYNSMGMEPASMYNLKGFLTRLLGNSQADLINMLSYAGLISAGIFMIYIWHGKWSTQAPAFDLRMALSLMMGLVFNLYLFPQDSLLLVLPGLLFYNYLRNRDLPRKHYVVFILFFPALFLTSQFSLIPETVVKIPFLAMAVLTVWMGFALYKENKYGDKFTESNIF